MALGVLPNLDTYVLATVLGSIAVVGGVLLYLFSKPSFPKNAPTLTREAWPILGSLQFFTERWDFFQKSKAHSQSGNFSFYAGQWPVVGLTGEEGRKLFFESKALAFTEGYSTLLGGNPGVKEGNNPLAEDRVTDSSFSQYFSKRIVAMLKGNQLKNGLPQLMQDLRTNLDKLAADPSGATDPFDSIYRTVFQLTMRTVACNEIADDPVMLAKCLKLYENIERTSSPTSIMFPWMPLPARVKRTYNGAQLYMIFKRVVDARNKDGRRGEDALQYLMDQGDNLTDIITFVLGALFAGQLNSGINAAWILVYLASNPYWLDKVREEVTGVANRYCSDTSLPLKEQLMQVPIEAWEAEFPLIDMCLKDSIRLQLSGTAFRKNMSGRDIPLNKSGTEVIPKDAFVTYAMGDIHYNPKIYENPDEWDPSRYMPDRAEDKKVQYAWAGWGVVSCMASCYRIVIKRNRLAIPVSACGSQSSRIT